MENRSEQTKRQTGVRRAAQHLGDDGCKVYPNEDRVKRDMHTPHAHTLAIRHAWHLPNQRSLSARLQRNVRYSTFSCTAECASCFGLSLRYLRADCRLEDECTARRLLECMPTPATGEMPFAEVLVRRRTEFVPLFRTEIEYHRSHLHRGEHVLC